MKQKFIRGAAVSAVVALVLVGLLGLMAAMSLAKPVQAADSGAITRWFVTTVSDGSTSYTGTQYLGSVYVANYGAVQLQVTGDVSDTSSTLTITPQFSNDPVSVCSSVSNWFDAKDTTIYNSQSVVIANSQVNTTTTTVITNSSTITQEVGYVITSTTSTSTPTYAGVTLSFVLTGDGTEARELPALGTCMRIKLAGTGSETYTPTIRARLVNRQ